MNPTFVRYYNNELQHLREVGAEFAREFPKIAGRLGLEEFECADPYVERMLEGLAFLAARLQLKIDREFPKFTQHLLEIVYPHYLAPTPSMAIVQFQPDLAEAGLADGFTVNRDEVLRGQIGRGEQTGAEFRTSRDVTLWPLEIESARYLPTAGDLSAAELSAPAGSQAGLRITLKTTAGVTTDEMALDELGLFIRGAGDVSVRLLEQIHGNGLGYSVLVRDGRQRMITTQPADDVILPGFASEEAVLPLELRAFQGYRLLQEYFTFAPVFHFVTLRNLNRGLAKAQSRTIDLVLYFDRSDPALNKAVEPDNFSLFCTPAVNLFSKKCDRVQVTNRDSELHVVPDRTRPMDFEIHSITSVRGFGADLQEGYELNPYYYSNDRINRFEPQAYYTQRRRQRMLSSRQEREGPRSSYIGSEVYVTPCDANEAPFPSALKQLAVEALCTNRDLALHMPVGQGNSDFALVSGAPVDSIRCLAGPTAPRPVHPEGQSAWRMISHLTLNYLSLYDPSEGNGAATLREMLELYIDRNDAAARKQVGGVRNIECERVVRRIPIPGPITAARGLLIKLTLDETQFEGSGIFVFGKIMEEFFARFVSVNSFTETVIASTERGEIMRWPVRLGRRRTI
ncbi:MAG: type VI secretion system baseplate subunit TssF [Xanthomonadales bacterium]|nr:type VI secretion system baseplate subunit TssF [Xanthomonadales bacterium]